MKNRILILTTLLTVSFLPGTALAQQLDSIRVDTSYFIAGQDDKNLLEAVIKNDLNSTSILIERGADPNTLSSIGNSPLMYAAEKGNIQIMKALIENGADVNISGFGGETALFLAIFKNDFQAAKYLLEQGANPNVKDDFGVTPLIYAAATNQYQSADLLMFYEADQTITDKDENDPLLAAVTFQNIETTDVLLQNGLNPNVQDNKGNTPAIVATQHGRYDILELLLEFEADVNISNEINYTPLAYAITFGDIQASKILVENGADIDHHVDKGRNMAELARINGKGQIINLIEENGGKIPPGPDFSELQFSYANSFNGTDWFMQFRGAIVDTKYGYYFETGFDYRPVLLRIQTTINDTIYQFRERRMGWSHGVGKYYKLYQSKNGAKLAAYTSLNGFLSFSEYSGTSNDPGVKYSLIPSAGIAFSGKYVGIKAGADWYNFENMLDKGLKINITAFFRISYPEAHYDRKEINWE